MADLSLAVRSLSWTVLFPGMVAGYVPWRFFGLREAAIDLNRPRIAIALAIQRGVRDIGPPAGPRELIARS